ncbi:MAG: glycoside hydrolase family protein, partial [Victivallaceae bacterium]
ANLALGIRLPAGNGIKEKITIPHVIYNDNPAAAPDRLVPHLRKEPGYALVAEEHRLPIPAVNVEWMSADKFLSLTMFSVPSQTPGGELWSVGGIHNGKNLEILCLSGVVAFNNRKDFIYGAQNKEFECPGFGYLSVKPGDVIRKTIAIDFAMLKQEGRGFGSIVRRGMELLQPQVNPVLSIKETIKLKENALLSRWREGESVSGFTWIPETMEEGNVYSASPGFLFGWVGQSLRLAWCAIELGIKGDKAWLGRGLAVMDSFASAPEAGGTPGLKYLFYDCNEKSWSGSEHRVLNRISSRMTGESLTNLAECILLLRKHGLDVKEEYLTSLRRGADFLCSPQRLTQDGIYPTFFGVDGSPLDNLITGGGTACIDAILAASIVFDDENLLDRGLEILDRYYELFGKTMERPFSCATLDAFCEDKESGIYFFLAAYRAFKITGREVYAEYAKLAAEWISTYVYFWNTGFKKGSICETNNFDSTFWPGVSVQNMHLDVFFPAYELYEFGKTIGDVQLTDIGKGVVAAWSHGIAEYPGHWGFPTPGEQGEQFNHTNYFQGRFTQEDWRGSANRWNPSWIIALVLQAAIRFGNEVEQSSDDCS